MSTFVKGICSIPIHPNFFFIKKKFGCQKKSWSKNDGKHVLTTFEKTFSETKFCEEKITSSGEKSRRKI